MNISCFRLGRRRVITSTARKLCADKCKHWGDCEISRYYNKKGEMIE